MTSKAKPSGRLSRLVYWELEKTLTFPMLAFMIAVALYQFVPASIGSSQSGVVSSLASVLDGFASGWAHQLSTEPITSFTFSVFIFAALTSMGLSRDISSGYMRAILSYPIRRAKLLLSKALVLLFVPFLVFISALVFVGALVFPSLFLRISVSDIAYIAAMLLLQMFFMFAVSFSASLYIKQPVMSFLASVVILISTEQISSYLSAPFKYLLPTEGTHVLRDYWFLHGVFELKYSPTDILMPIIGMLIIPIIITVINFVYFTKRFQT